MKPSFVRKVNRPTLASSNSDIARYKLFGTYLQLIHTDTYSTSLKYFVLPTIHNTFSILIIFRSFYDMTHINIYNTFSTFKIYQSQYGMTHLNIYNKISTFIIYQSFYDMTHLNI